MFDQALIRGGSLKNLHKQVPNPVLYEDRNPDIYVVLDNYLSPRIVKDRLVRLIRKATGDPGIQLKVLTCIPYREDPQRIDSNPTNYYKRYGLDLSKLIPPGSKIVTVGRALTHLTQGNLLPHYFYDIVFNRPYFYTPQLRSWVWPVDEFRRVVEHPVLDKKDNQKYDESGAPITYRKNEGWGYEDKWQQFFAFRQLKLAKEAPITDSPPAETTYIKVKDFSRFYADHHDDPTVAIDTETDSTDPFKATLGVVTLSFDGETGYYINWDTVPDAEEFGRFLHHKFQVYQNGQYDTKVLRNNGVPFHYLHIDHDTMVVGNALNEMSANALDTLTWIYTPYGGYQWPLQDYIARHNRIKSYLDIPERELLPYATMDAIVTLLIYRAQLDQIQWIDENYPPEADQEWFNVPLRYNLRHYLYTWVMPAVNAFNAIEWDGMYINIEALREEGRRLTQEIEQAAREVRETFGMPETLNIDSHEQLAKFIKQKGYPTIRRGKNGFLPLLNDDTINELEKRGYSEFRKIQHYRKLCVFMSTFIGDEKRGDGYWQYLRYHPEDGSYRVHSSMMVFMKNSGRNGSRSPNLQNIPKRGEGWKRIRRIFCPPSPDYLIGELDGKGYQLRIGAALSGDEEMRRAFSDPKIGGDLHIVTTQAVLRRDLTLDEVLELKKKGDPVIEEQRFKGKQANLSLEFGSSGFAFASNTLVKEWSLKEVEKYLRENQIEDKPGWLYHNRVREDQHPIRGVTMEFCKYWAVGNDIRRKYFERYQGLGQWIDDFSKFAEGRGYTRSVHGALRRLPQLLYPQASDVLEGYFKTFYNITINSPVQNFENVVMSGKVTAGLKKFCEQPHIKSIVANMVHDSVVVYIHKDEVQLIVDKARELFEAEEPENNGVPMELEAKIADYYGKGEVWGEGYEL